MESSVLNYLSSWASLISLVLTVVNTYLILRVRAGIVVNLTLEPLLLRLRENSAEMNQHLSYYELKGQRFSEAARVCEANVRTVRRRLGYFRSGFVRAALRSMRKFHRNRSAANAQEVYANLQQVCQHIANVLEEKRITG